MTTNQDKKLGRGLSALLGESRTIPSTKVTSSKEAPQANLVTSIPLSRIIAGIYQPRRKFTQSELSELADSIKENGLIQPILVRKSEESGHFEIIAGERRYRAYKILKMQSIPAIVKKINNHEALELAIVENVQRSDLTLIEEALGYKQLMDDFSYTQDQVANMSIGVNLLISLTEKVSSILRDDFDIEIVEMHHKNKVDSPSGTALSLGTAAAKGRLVDIKDTAVMSRVGNDTKRKRGQIGFAALRGGDVIGDHSVVFAGEGERVELTHKATNRSVFASGAVRAAIWGTNQNPGFYLIKDVLS